MRKTGDVDVFTGSTINAVALLPEPILATDVPWVPFYHQRSQPSGVGSEAAAAGVLEEFDAAGDTYLSDSIYLEDTGIDYGGEDVEVFIQFQLRDTAPGGSDTVEFELSARFIKLDGTHTLLNSIPVSTTVTNVSSWTANQLHVVSLGTITGVTDAKMLFWTLMRDVSDLYPNTAEVFGIYFEQV